MQGAEQTEGQSSLAPPGAVCRRCRYGLRGLPEHGACPECTAPISASTDPAWWGSRPIDELAAAADASRQFAAATVALSIALVFASWVFSETMPVPRVVECGVLLVLSLAAGCFGVSIVRCVRRFLAAQLCSRGAALGARACLIVAGVGGVTAPLVQLASDDYPARYHAFAVAALGAVGTLAAWSYLLWQVSRALIAAPFVPQRLL